MNKNKDDMCVQISYCVCMWGGVCVCVCVGGCVRARACGNKQI